MRALRVVALLLVALVASGCTTAARPRPGNGSSGTGRLLLLPRDGTPENHAIASRAAALFARGLRPVGEVWNADDLVREAAVAGNGSWSVRLVERMSLGGWPSADDRIELLKLGLTGLVTIEVTEYDQVWGRYAKFTRASVEAQAFDVVTGAQMWRIHRANEVEDLRGRAFEQALDGAVGDLVASIQPGTSMSAIDLWRWWRR